jgi:hypothetical protein
MTARRSNGKNEIAPCAGQRYGVRMNTTAISSCLAAGLLVCAWSVATADTITLKSGVTFKGQILSEDAHEVQIAVSRTADDGIRTIKVIRQSLVERMERGAPDLAIESDPTALGREDGSEPERPDTDGAREAIAKADRLLAGGSYDDAIAAYRVIGTRAETILQENEDDESLQRETLRIREEAARRLVIALEGKHEHIEESIRVAEKEAREVERRMDEHRDEIDKIERESRPRDDRQVRRIGSDVNRPIVSAEIKEHEAWIAVAEKRLTAHRGWVQEQKLMLVNVETEIDIAEEKERQATEARKSAEKARRRR